MATVKNIKIKTETKPGEVSGIYMIPEQPKALLVLAHGAGAGMLHIFMEELSQELADQYIATLRFNFPYMEAGRKAPGSARQAIETWYEVTQRAKEDYGNLPIIIGGKSYGGRMASHLLAANKFDFIQGLIFYGFPLHAPGKDGKGRAQHLKDINVPMLFLQGEKDKLANIDLIKEVVDALPDATLKVYEHADHSFKRPKKIAKESLIPKLVNDTSDWINLKLRD